SLSSAASLIACWTAWSGGVRPVVLVVDPVRLVEGDGESGRRSAEGALSGFALFPDEPLRQIDVDDVILAGHGILEDVAAPLPDAFDAEGAPAASALDGDLPLLEAHHLEGRSEQLPRQAAELAGEDLRERLHLLVGGGGVDDASGVAVAFGDRLGPHEDGRPLDAAQVHRTAAPLRHGEADEGLAATVLRVRKPAEVAATPEVAVAEFVATAGHRPSGFRRSLRCFCHWRLLVPERLYLRVTACQDSMYAPWHTPRSGAPGVRRARRRTLCLRPPATA